jgi:hypothetical protein
LLHHICCTAFNLETDPAMTENPFLISDWWEIPPNHLSAFLDWHDEPYRAGFARKPNVQRLYAIDGRPDAHLSWNEFNAGAGADEKASLPAGWPGSEGAVSHQRFRCKLMRDVGHKPHLPAPWLYIVHTDIPDYIVDEYNAWYDEEHLPRLVTVPGILRARRYVAQGANPRYLTAYDLTDRDAFESPAGLKARKTPWTEKMRSLFFNTRRSMALLVKYDS